MIPLCDESWSSQVFNPVKGFWAPSHLLHFCHLRIHRRPSSEVWVSCQFGSDIRSMGRLPVCLRPSEVWVGCQFVSDQVNGHHDPLLRGPSICPFQKLLCCEGLPSVHSSDWVLHAFLSLSHICGIYIWRHPKIELLRMRKRIHITRLRMRKLLFERILIRKSRLPD